MKFGPYFSPEKRRQNPILGAEDRNGYFDAMHRRRTLYGKRWFKVTGKTPDGIPVEDRISPFQMLIPKISTKKNYTIDSQDLYLAGVGGRDLLEGLYLLEQVANRNSLTVVLFLFFLPLVFFFTIASISNPAAWLFWFSYLVLFLEIVQDFKMHLGVGGINMRNELMRWRALSKKRISVLKLFLDLIALTVILALVFVGIFVAVFAIAVAGFAAVELAKLISAFYTNLGSEFLSTFFIKQGGYQIASIFVFLFAFLLAITRESRRQFALRTILKAFEEGRRDYDAYYLADVQKDHDDAIGWVTFFYDFGISKEEETLFEKFFASLKLK